MRHEQTEHHIDGIGIHFDRKPVSEWFRSMGREVTFTQLDDGEQLVFDGLHTFTMGSVVGYALRCNEDPVAAIDRARKNGHQLVWINANGAMISNQQRVAKGHIRVTIGMVVRFQGNLYTIERAPNQNLQLKPMVLVNVEA
jgi:hypothetical protein